MAQNEREALDEQPTSTETAATRAAGTTRERSSRSHQGRPGGRSDRPTGRGRARPTGRGQRWGGSRRGKVCAFCVDKVSVIDYKGVSLLRGFVTEHGKIKARRKTGTCAKHQRRLALAIKRARHLALLPYSAGHTRSG